MTKNVDTCDGVLDIAEYLHYNSNREGKMFSKRQKIALIISLWLYFVWIFFICALMRADFQGNFVGCMVIGGIGCTIVLILYLIVFVDRYFISKSLKQSQNIMLIKVMRRDAYIKAIYFDIIGFFLLATSSLLVDKEEIHSLRLAWFIILSAAIVATHIVLFISTYKKYKSSVNVLSLQEKNAQFC